MGSHETDYDGITDEIKLKCRDKESIVAGAVDDYAEVTLTNGGYPEDKPDDSDDCSDDCSDDDAP